MNDLSGGFDKRRPCCGSGESDDLVPAKVLISVEQERADRLETWAGRYGSPALFIPPSQVRPWLGNARDYDSLTYENVADLIESIKSSGQSVAALVRPIKNSEYKYEALTGTRRLFAVKWLCENYAEFPFIAVCRWLSDEQAFLEADLENRVRSDVSALERGRNYAFALEAHYNGHQKRMAKAIGISEAQATRYLSIASLPASVISAFGDKGVTLVTGHEIAEALRDDARAKHILAEAERLADSQKTASERGLSQASPAVVGRKLLNCHKSSAGEAHQTVIMSETGRPMVSVKSVAKKGITLRVHAGSGANLAELQAKLSDLLVELGAEGKFSFE